jgi:hypothetical protein
MNKKQVQQRVLQNGKLLPLDKFEWDEKSNTFSSNEDDLVLDFQGINNCTFKTGSDCTFKTGSDCTFKTGFDCTFKTGFDCTFKTGSYCTFDTGSYCTFDTGCGCIFKTGSSCTFDTGFNCTFDTGSYCTFDTGFNCTFNAEENCVVVRRDIHEVIEIPFNTKIKLNECGVKGYQIMEDTQTSGKRVKIKVANGQILEGEIIED